MLYITTPNKLTTFSYDKKNVFYVMCNSNTITEQTCAQPFYTDKQNLNIFALNEKTFSRYLLVYNFISKFGQTADNLYRFLLLRQFNKDALTQHCLSLLADKSQWETVTLVCVGGKATKSHPRILRDIISERIGQDYVTIV